jgi:hypothetical protein
MNKQPINPYASGSTCTSAIKGSSSTSLILLSRKRDYVGSLRVITYDTETRKQRNEEIGPAINSLGTQNRSAHAQFIVSQDQFLTPAKLLEGSMKSRKIFEPNLAPQGARPSTTCTRKGTAQDVSPPDREEYEDV